MQDSLKTDSKMQNEKQRITHSDISRELWLLPVRIKINILAGSDGGVKQKLVVGCGIEKKNISWTLDSNNNSDEQGMMGYRLWVTIASNRHLVK